MKPAALIQPPRGMYLVDTLARRKGINPKTARGKLRKHFGGKLSDFGLDNWTYGPESEQLILDIIGPARTNAAEGSLRAEALHRDLEQTSFANGDLAETSAELDPLSWIRKPRSEITLDNQSGVYALFLRKGSSLPLIRPLAEGLIYIGLASNFRTRCHFRGNTGSHSPRRSLAVLLAEELNLKFRMAANGNYQLELESEKKLDAWMHANLLIALCPVEDFKSAEHRLIAQYAPPLNLTHCEQSEQHRQLKDLRGKALKLARGRS